MAGGAAVPAMRSRGEGVPLIQGRVARLRPRHVLGRRELPPGVGVPPQRMKFLLWLRCGAFSAVRECDCVLVMGTSLSGLTIDNVAHGAGRAGLPLLVFDMGSAPVESLRGHGAWSAERDCHLQGPLDLSILEVLFAMGWLDQLFDFLPHLCLGSLRTLRQFVLDRGADDTAGALVAKLDAAIVDEVERESRFYGDE